MLFKILKTKVLRKRALVTLLVVAAFQIFSTIALPGVTTKTLNNPMFTLLNVTSGGGYTNLSLMALGISPYITASIIVQMLSNGLVKSLTRYAKEGRVGVKKLNRLTKILTIVFAVIQAPTLILTFNRLGALGMDKSPTLITYILASTIVVTGAMVAMFMGDTLNQYGLGNGPSLLITGNIVVQFPHTIKTVFSAFKSPENTHNAIMVIATLVVGLLIIVWMNGVEKHLPLQHMRELNRTSKAGYLPIKLNPAGMVPVIFTSAIMSIMSMLAQLKTPFTKVLALFDMSKPQGLVIYAVLTLIFGVSYSLIQMSPERVTRHLNQSGTYIVGVDLNDTKTFLTKEIRLIGGVGSVFLIFIGILPYLTGVAAQVSLISVLIVVSSVLETSKQIGGISEKYAYETSL